MPAVANGSGMASGSEKIQMILDCLFISGGKINSSRL
jgi:hypothetical protein